MRKLIYPPNCRPCWLRMASRAVFPWCFLASAAHNLLRWMDNLRQREPAQGGSNSAGQPLHGPGHQWAWLYLDKGFGDRMWNITSWTLGNSYAGLFRISSPGFWPSDCFFAVSSLPILFWWPLNIGLPRHYDLSPWSYSGVANCTC